MPTGVVATFGAAGTGTQTSVVVTGTTTTTGVSFSSGGVGYNISSNSGTLTVDLAASGNTSITTSGNFTGTSTFSGNVVFQNSFSATSSDRFNLTGGEIAFTGSLTLNNSVANTNGGGILSIGGALIYGNNNVNLTWDPVSSGAFTATSGNFYFNPSSVSFGTGTYTLTTYGQGKIEIQQNIGSGYNGGLVIGESSGTFTSASAYINTSGVSIGANVSMGPTPGTGTVTTGGTYTLGMDATGPATGTVTGTVTFDDYNASTSTDNFDVAASDTLTISGPLVNKLAETNPSAANTTVTKTSAGTLILSGTNNTYASPTQVNGGSLLAANGASGSATGSGALTVGANGTIGGYSSTTSTVTVGTFLTSGYTVSGNVIAGDGNDATSTVALLAAGATGSFTSAKVAFNLDSTSTNASQLQVSANGVSNSINFANTTLTLNVLNSATIAPNTAYNLIYDPNGFNSSTDGLTITNGVITSGLSIGNSTYFGASSGGYATGYYAGSYLFESANGNYIDVEVVPEPSTMALLLGGGICLLLVVRRRSRGNDSR